MHAPLALDQKVKAILFNFWVSAADREQNHEWVMDEDKADRFKPRLGLM
jgi:hypothetical protein